MSGSAAGLSRVIPARGTIREGFDRNFYVFSVCSRQPQSGQYLPRLLQRIFLLIPSSE